MSLTGLVINPGVTINAGVTLNGFAPSSGPSVATQSIWLWNSNYVGPNLVLGQVNSWYGNYNGKPVYGNSTQEVSATNSETSSALGNIDGNGSLYDVSPLVMFTIYVNTEDTGDAASGIASVGVGNYNTDLTQQLGKTADSWGWYQDGTVWGNGELSNSGYPTWGPGDYLDIALNLNDGHAWVRVNGGDWNGRAGTDPAVGNHRITLPGGFVYNGSGSGGIFPAANPSASAFVDAMDAWYYTYSIPTGFTAL